MVDRRRTASRWISRVIFSDVLLSSSRSSSLTGVSSMAWSSLDFDSILFTDDFDESFFIGVFSTLVGNELNLKNKTQNKNKRIQLQLCLWQRSKAHCSINNRCFRCFNIDHLSIFSEFKLKWRNISLWISSSRFRRCSISK